MKKTVLTIVMSLFVTSVFSAVIVPLTVQITDPSTTCPSHGKAPIRIPAVWQEGYELQFDNLYADYTLVLTDSSDNVVYSTFIPAGTTQVFLPTTLSGSYTLRLVGDTFSFIGSITL